MLPVVIGLVLVAIVGAVFAFLKGRSDSPPHSQAQVQQQQLDDRSATSTTTTRSGLNRLRNRRAPRQNVEEEEVDDVKSSDSDDFEFGSSDEEQEEVQEVKEEFTEEEKEMLSKLKGTAHKKALMKLRRKKEKEQKKEMMDQRNQYLERKRELEAQKEREIEAKRDEEYQAKLEVQRKEKEEKQKKSQEEYEQWRHLFEEEQKGEAADFDLDNNSDLLSQFIQYIKDYKVIVLEDLAYQFKIKTEQAIDRIRSLESSGKITGLLDDRGKFIYINEEELAKVKEFIELQGRVSISELSRESNKLIDLRPKEENVNVEELLNKN